MLEGGVAKTPTAGQMEYGELAVNYNVDDPAMFIKDSDNNIIRISNMRDPSLDYIPDLGNNTWQPGTLDDRYLSLYSWANVPLLSTAP